MPIKVKRVVGGQSGNIDDHGYCFHGAVKEGAPLQGIEGSPAPTLACVHSSREQ